MSDTFESAGTRVRRALFKPIFSARLRDTPLRDLVRGRMTGRLNYKLPIAAAPLPQPMRDLILRVVRRTRLWRIEKTDVANELIAHFIDGVASGATVDELIQNFGDERQAAKLIRRAKRRNRSMFWHARRWAFRALLVIIGLYVIGVIRFFCGSPRVKVDYLAQLNAPALAVPESDRAWPLLRQAIAAMHEPPPTSGGAPSLDPRAILRDDRSELHWQIATQWLDQNQPTIELIRQASQKRVFGFVYGPGGSAEDPTIGWTGWQKSAAVVSPMLASIYFPDLSEMRATAHVMAADLRLAVERGDATRAQRDYDTVLNLANLIDDTPILVCNLVAIGIDAMAFDRLAVELLQRPEKFNDATLIALAHRTSRVGGETASSLIKLDGEQMIFDDMIQRIYTDDGHGDGRLTPSAVQTLALVSAGPSDADRASAGQMMATATLSLVDSRRDNVLAHDQVLQLFQRTMSKPYREGAATASREAEDLSTGWNVSPMTRAHYLVASLLTPSLNRASATGERILAARDALATALALELYRRHHDGRYPQTLDGLVPDMLPSVPVDRINGEPLKYRIVNGKPLLYSVGVDGNDDGGRVPLDFHGQPSRFRGAIGQDRVGPEHRPSDGDWVLYGQPLLDEKAQDLAEELQAENHREPATGPTTAPTTQLSAGM